MEVGCLNKYDVRTLLKRVQHLEALNRKLAKDNKEHLHRRREMMRDVQRAEMECDRLVTEMDELHAQIATLDDRYDEICAENARKRTRE